MIELNSKTQQDFLNREWVQKLLDAGVDMSDAKYYLCKYKEIDNICMKAEMDNMVLVSKDIRRVKPDAKFNFSNFVPTYTVSELLYKLHEWIYPTIDGKEFSGGLKMFKDAPLYVFWYDLQTENYDVHKSSAENYGEWSGDFFAGREYPIESLASLLIQCHTKDIGLKTKDTGNISDK